MRFFLFTLLLFLVVSGCDRENQPTIPYAYVNLQLYPNSLDYIETGGYKYVDAGYKGLIVYRPLPDEFFIFERCCPYDPEHEHAVVSVDKTGLTCTDSVCGSQYVLYNGTPNAGPSSYPLMQYRYTYDGDLLHIYN
jgi:hypothetical protein